MTDINDLVQEFWETSSDEAVGASFFAMRRLLEILQDCFDFLERLANPNSWRYSARSHLDDHIRAKLKILLEGYRKMFDQSFSKSKDLGDMLKFLPGVVVQNYMSIQGMAVLYRIEPDLLECLIKSTIEPLRATESLEFPYSRYILDDYLSGFLQDRDRSQLYYCDPELQHMSICRQFLSLLDGSNAIDLQSDELSEYVNRHLDGHLRAATTVFLYARNISDHHPAVEILRDLESCVETTAYYVDKNSSGYILALCIIQVILKWGNMLICHLKVGAGYCALCTVVSLFRHNFLVCGCLCFQC